MSLFLFVSFFLFHFIINFFLSLYFFSLSLTFYLSHSHNQYFSFFHSLFCSFSLSLYSYSSISLSLSLSVSLSVKNGNGNLLAFPKGLTLYLQKQVNCYTTICIPKIDLYTNIDFHPIYQTFFVELSTRF